VTHEEWAGPIADQRADIPIVSSSPQFTGRVWSTRRDTIEFGGQRIDRDVLVHPGAVSVIALDDAERVLLVRQYRHPVGMWLFEPPAGLLDIPGENPWHTAQRELAEEAGYRASDWSTLVDLLNSPGGSSEAIRIYLARDITALPDGRIHTGEAEEAELPRVWVPLEDAVDLVLSGQIANPTAVTGILAAAAARARGWTSLRPAETPWSTRDHLLETNRVHNRDSEAK
jgi:8-oxo-dGTP pyrophosphatase MutT (NUDIX family)